LAKYLTTRVKSPTEDSYLAFRRLIGLELGQGKNESVKTHL